MRWLVDCIPVRENPVWLDAGCGSGAIIILLDNELQIGTYIGIDILLAGLASA